ncbi:hypothetical protein [Pedobacter ginsengisoli]|uniref:hypothetical protein n=1 Tax=Pedobacter ginsengisoli TaxID=363852 RepID=UPI00254BDDC2|nr:hypothetical protein [Pedobacter ginsengisoli]
MKKLIILTITCIALLTACNSKGTKDTKDDATDLTELPKSDTLKIDFKPHWDMLLILTIMPDSITTNWKWTKQDRIDFRESIQQHNYYVDTTLENGIITKFNNDYIKTQSAKGTFELAAYRIKDGQYVILTKEKTKDKQYFTTYELFRMGAAIVPEKEIIGDYRKYLLKDTTRMACFKILDKNARFDYDLTEPGKLRIKLKDVSKDEAEGCLTGNSVALKFDERVRPFVLEGIKWEEK